MSITSLRTGTTGLSVALDNNYMEPIATTLVGSGGANQITFTDIPQTYKHLQIRGIAKSSANGSEDLRIQFNGDAGSIYAVHGLYGNGSSVSANSGTSQTAVVQPYNFVVASSVTSVFGAVVYDILDYTNTSKYTTVRTLGGNDNNGSGTVGLYSGLWLNTDAITSIKLFPTNNSFAQHTRFSLYGIKG